MTLFCHESFAVSKRQREGNFPPLNSNFGILLKISLNKYLVCCHVLSIHWDEIWSIQLDQLRLPIPEAVGLGATNLHINPRRIASAFLISDRKTIEKIYSFFKPLHVPSVPHGSDPSISSPGKWLNISYSFAHLR